MLIRYMLYCKIGTWVLYYCTRSSGVMNAIAYLEVLRAVRDGNYDEVFRRSLEAFNLSVAIEALIYAAGNDKKVYETVRRSFISRQETEEILSKVWPTERIRHAKAPEHEFNFFISLHGDDQYRIAVSVSLDEGHPDVWFHHQDTHERKLSPEQCIDWSNLDSESEAMWTFLVSKIEHLSEKWFRKSAEECNRSLIIPYEEYLPNERDQ